MATRRLEVVITGDASQLDKALGKTQKSADRLRKGMLIAGGAIAGGLAIGLKKSVDAAMESEKAQARLGAAMKGAGVSQAKYGKEIEANIQRTSKLAALDDEELSDSFAKLVRTTGDVTKATEGMNLAADIARSRNVSLAQATRAVERAFIGSATGLQRFGIETETTRQAQELAKKTIDSWRDANGKLSESEEVKAKQLKHSAKQLDEQTTALGAIAKAQEKFAGGAEAYGKTSAAAQERFQVALENLQEKLGTAVLPILRDFIARLTDLLGWVERNQSAVKVIVGVLAGLAAVMVTVSVGMRAVQTATQLATAAQVAYNIALSANPIGVVVIALAALAAGVLLAYRRSETFREIVDGLWSKLKGLASWIREHWGTISSVIANSPMIVAFRTMNELIDDIVGNVRWLIDNLSRIPSVFGGSADPGPGSSGGRFGSSGDRGPAPRVPGPTGGSNIDQLRSFAHSLGFNPSHGQMTGGTHTPGSLHYQGKAIDLSGSPDQMRNAFYAAIQTFGGRLNELFYDPIGWYMDMGKRIPGAIGGHGNHVHVGLFDNGGILKPGLNLAINGTGRNEFLTRGSGVTVNVYGDVTGTELVRRVRDELTRMAKSGASMGFVGA